MSRSEMPDTSGSALARARRGWQVTLGCGRIVGNFHHERTLPSVDSVASAVRAWRFGRHRTGTAGRCGWATVSRLTLLPAAVSPLVAAEVAGAPRRCRVLAAFPTCLYLDLGAHERVLAVLASDAVALPIGLRLALPSTEVRWGVEPGAHVVVGEGRVRLPRADVVARPAAAAGARAPGGAARTGWRLPRSPSPASSATSPTTSTAAASPAARPTPASAASSASDAG